MLVVGLVLSGLANVANLLLARSEAEGASAPFAALLARAASACPPTGDGSPLLSASGAAPARGCVALSAVCLRSDPSRFAVNQLDLARPVLAFAAALGS